MKKLLMSTIILFLFSISTILVQVSCSKSNSARINSPVGKILYMTIDGAGINFWTADDNGNNQTKINLDMPPNVTLWNYADNYPVLSPDKSKIYFRAEDNTLAAPLGVYSANTDGSDVTRIISPPAGTFVHIEEVY